MNQLKPVLDFIKAQIFLLCCAVVVVLALVSLWWPFGTMAEETQRDMKDEYNKKAAIETLTRSRREFPGLVYTSSNKEVAPVPPGVVMPALTKLKTQASERMMAQKDEIDTAAARGNKRNRVDEKTGVPLFNNVSLPGYLPHKDTAKGINYHLFREAVYKPVFDTWTKRLLGQSDVTAGMVPTAAALKEAAQRDAAAKANEYGSLSGRQNYETTVADTSSFIRSALVNRAISTPMYLDPDKAFQRRGFITEAREPTENEVFEAFVDCWLQNDVVEAIVDTNAGSAEVAKSRVKNLLAIVVGDTAVSAFGAATPGGAAAGGGFSSFGAPANPQGSGYAGPMDPRGMGGGPGYGPPPGGPGAATPAAGATSPTMTGRTSNTKYDVTYMTISMVAEPTAINAFIDSLYKRNNGYTVVNCKTTAVDPYDAASRGFIYGKTQCVQVDLLVEVLFFKDWTSKVAPQAAP